MANRLPKQFWRVVVLDATSLRHYDRKSKTYAAQHHAVNAAAGFEKQGIPVEIWTTGPVEWTKL